MRGLTEVKTLINDQGKSYVNQGVYNSDSRGNNERHTRAEDRLSELEKNMQDSEKLKRSQRLNVTLAISVPIITLVGNYFINHP